ncbi:MAG: hypothetical protein MJA82_10010, partial [Clostridia bacterium]|nr:hypothetical protein [Clostridia bacterium]
FNVFNFISKDSIDILIEKVNGRRKFGKSTQSNWDKICNFILKGDVQHLLINNSQDKVPYDSEFALSVTCDYNEEYSYMNLKNPIANNISFAINEKIFSGTFPLNVQEKVVKFLKNIFVKFNGIYGFITFERKWPGFTPIPTPLEQILNINYIFNSYKFKNKARGYFWANILSEEHILKLGGFDNVKKTAPCYIIENIELDNKKALYLQLTPDINDYSDEKLLELKKFLSPVLPEEDMDMINQMDPNEVVRRHSRLVF